MKLLIATIYLVLAVAGCGRAAEQPLAPKSSARPAAQARPPAAPEPPAAAPAVEKMESEAARDSAQPASAPQKAAPASMARSREGAGAAQDVLRGPAFSAEEMAILAQYDALVRRREAEPLTGETPCGSGCSFRQRICELSVRICAISGRHRDAPEIAEKCQDGRQRCRSAQEITARCGCAQ